MKDKKLEIGLYFFEGVLDIFMILNILGTIDFLKGLLVAYSIIGIISHVITFILVVVMIILISRHILTVDDLTKNENAEPSDPILYHTRGFINGTNFIVLLLSFMYLDRAETYVYLYITAYIIMLINIIPKILIFKITGYSRKEMYLLQLPNNDRNSKILKEYKDIISLLKLDGDFNSKEIKKERKAIANYYYDYLK